MSITTPIAEYLNNQYEWAIWFWRHSSFFNLLVMPYWIAMRRERGTDFPYYFPEEAYFIQQLLKKTIEKIDLFVHYHELERNREGDYNKTFAERSTWVSRNFHYYSNDTMANLFFAKKLPQRDYTRVKNLYNNYAVGLLAYNSLSGVALIALNNFFFRSRKTSMPVVFLASLSCTGLIALNFHLSYKVVDSFFNENVRRLGYNGLIHKYGSHYPRNVDFSYY